MNSKKVRVAVSGLGKLGGSFVSWAEQQDGLSLAYAVDPRHRPRRPDVGAGSIEVPTFRSWSQVPEALRRETDVVVDCATKGEGARNLGFYQEANLPAVFQSGEDPGVGDLFHPRLANQSSSRYLRVGKCSALITCNVVAPLSSLGAFRVRGHYMKVNNDDQMLNFRYRSAHEVRALLGMPAAIDVVYLRGATPTSGYSYHGFLDVKFSEAISRDEILEALSRAPDVLLVSDHDGLDTRRYQPVPETLVFERGIEVELDDLTVHIPVLAFTPTLTFPQNLDAISYLAHQQ